MPTVVVEKVECLGTVLMSSGHEVSLLKFETETIESSLHQSRGRLEQGKRYRVTFEEVPGDLAETHHEQKE